MKLDTWNPKQYEKFREQRAQPFWDLLAMVKPDGISSGIDLGCGTGELTAEIAKRNPNLKLIGIDNSQAMLNRSKKLETSRLHFQNQDLNTYDPREKFDLLFSNAAIQWIDDHESFYPKILSWVTPEGQAAIQIPYNFDHASHRIAHEVAKQFPKLQINMRAKSQLSQERYSDIFYQAGFHEQKNRIEIYLHPMHSGAEVIEWTKGTLLTQFQEKLSEEEFKEFLSIYSEMLLAEIGGGPYLYAFKRLLIWARRN